MDFISWILGLGLFGFIALIAKRYFDDIVLDRSFRALYVETRTKLPSVLAVDLMEEMTTLTELERVAILEGTPPQHAARMKKRAAVASMAARLRLHAQLRNLNG